MYTEHIILASLLNKTQRNKDNTTAMRKGKASLWALAGNTVYSFQLNEILKHIFYVSFHRITKKMGKPVLHIDYEVYTERIIWSSLFNKRQRNKEKITAMKKGKASLWLLAGLDSQLFPEGLILKLLLAGETFNLFLINGI